MKTINKITLSYYVAFIALGLTVATLGPTLLGLAEQTNSQINQISILFIARSFGFLIGALLAGRLYDRFPGHKLMAASLTMIAIMMVLVPFTPTLWLLTAVMLLIGLFEPGVDVGGNTLISWLHRDKVGPYMNGLHFFFGVGAFLSPFIIAWALSVSDGIQWAFWVSALIILVPAFLVFNQPSPKPIITSDSNQNGKRQRNSALILLIALFFFLYAGAEVGFSGWISTYVIAQGLSSEELAVLLTSAFWGALTLGRLLGIPLAVRFRNRSIILADLGGCLLSVAVILIWPNSLTAVWIGTMGLGLSMASVFPTTLSLAEKHFPVSGKTTSYFFVGASLGGMTIPWLIGQAFAAIGPVMALVIIFGGLLSSTAVFGILLWQITRSEEKETVIQSPIN